jgi:hypothetical protein
MSRDCRRFVPPPKQHHKHPAVKAHIDPKPRTAIDPNLGGSLADRLQGRGIAGRESRERRRDDRRCVGIEIIEPVAEGTWTAAINVFDNPDHYGTIGVTDKQTAPLV